MIWGIQWDETLKWLIDTGEKTHAEIASDSTSWGNYYNNSFTYYTNTSKSTATKAANSITRIPSGAYEGANANNVFDLAGNVWDWTCESYDLMNSGSYNSRCSRGGDNGYGYNYPAAYRNNQYPQNSDGIPLGGYNFVGMRCALYVK